MLDGLQYLTYSSALSSHFFVLYSRIFEKDIIYRINFVVYNCKVDIEIELARDVDNLFVSELADN